MSLCYAPGELVMECCQVDIPKVDTPGDSVSTQDQGRDDTD